MENGKWGFFLTNVPHRSLLDHRGVRGCAFSAAPVETVAIAPGKEPSVDAHPFAAGSPRTAARIVSSPRATGHACLRGSDEPAFSGQRSAVNGRAFVRNDLRLLEHRTIFDTY